MAIKLKNNKFLSVIMTGGIVFTAVLVFMLQYGRFEKKAAEYKTEENKSESLAVSQLLESNYVLYKNLREKVDKTEYSYADLYIEEEVLDSVTRGKVDSIVSMQVEGQLEDSIRQRKMALEEELSFYQYAEYVREHLSTAIDYCVIDKATGIFIKNTGHAIEALEEQTTQEAALPYVYYIKVEYDDVGHAGNIAVKSTDADKTLKLTQKLTNPEYLNEDEGINFFFGAYDEAEEREVEYYINYKTTEPKNVTFIYAITPEQWDALGVAGLGALVEEYNESYDSLYAYYHAGVHQWYMWMLLILAVVALLMPRYHKYRLQESAVCKLPIELECIVGLLIMFGGNDLVVRMVQNMIDGIGQRTPVVNGLLLITNALVIAAFFTVWYIFVISFWEISQQGLRTYLGERSLLCRFWKHTKNFWMEKWHKYKSEMLDIELSKDNTKALLRMIILNFVILFIISCMWVFGGVVLILYSVVVYFLMKKYIKRIQEQYKKLLQATGSIAKGNLDTALNDDWGVFESYKAELAKIQDGFKNAVDEEVKSQRMRTELITNVSHDLKTPLTAIITYVDLLKNPEITEEERREYIEILDRKSLRLKVLIEDLFEVSKANSRNVTLDIVDVDIVGLMKQVSLELEDKIKNAELDVRWDIPEERIVLPLDSQKTYRIFENLYMNIIKYAMPSTRVYIKAEKQEDEVRIELKNISSAELPENPMELTERFVRGDVSRNTEGAGLGLAIAKSFVELQNGKMFIETDGDLFKVIIVW